MIAQLRKKIFFSLIFIALSTKIRSDGFSILYVHLGNEVPRYLYDSIKQTRAFNPNGRLFVVCYEKNIEAVKVALDSSNVCCVASQELPISHDHALFLKRTRYSGFWRFASERFFYIEQVIKKYNLTDIFHLESDNLLYVNLEDCLSLFRTQYPGIGATFDNDSRCIAGFMYIKDILSISKLNEFFASVTENNYNDMQIIALFRKKHPTLINHLPIVPDIYKDFYPLKNLQGAETNFADQYSNNFKSFNSIFDAAAIGQYLGGIDSIHKKQDTIGFINESCLFSPANFSYEWKLDDCGRKIPFIKIDNKIYRINNLHIHSKNLKNFTS